MAINLSRNSKVFFTTNITSAGAVLTNGFTPNNTQELQVLDGFTFSQSTNSEAITVSESGTTPIRGQRSFNSSLAPVDFSFSTYIRPFNNTATNKITAEENVLWNALLGKESLITPPTVLLLGTGSYNGVTGAGTVTGVTYAAATGKITVAGTGFTAATTAKGVVAGDTVVLSGLATSLGLNASYLNSLATIDAGFSDTSIVFTLVNTPANTTTTVTTPSVLVVSEVTAAPLNTLQAITAATVTSGAYAYTAATNTGVITLNGTALPVLTPSTTVYTLTGIGTAPTASTPVSATAAMAANLNGAVTITGSTANVLTLQMVIPYTEHSVLTWTAATPVLGSVNLLKSSLGETSFNSYVSTAISDQNQLQNFGMIFLIDNVVYAVDNCALSQVTIDYGLDQIATAQWTGQGTVLKKLADATSTADSTNVLTNLKAAYFTSSAASGSSLVTGAFTPKNTAAKYITNKLTTAKLTSVNALKNSAGTTVITAGLDFDVAVTGGSFTVNNNITYLTPSILSSVNTPVTYFAGTRTISGTITAYLRTGTAGDTGDLLEGVLAAAAANTTEPLFRYNSNIGGATAPYAQIFLPTVFLQVPTVDIQQIVSTTINFMAEGSSTAASVSSFDLQKTNDAFIKYFAA